MNAAQSQGASGNYSSSNLRVKSSPERSTSMTRQNQTGASQQNQVPNVPTDFTEVFSWGSDRHGQLGLGS